MDRINYTRVVTGGLLAGLIINVGEFVLNEPILGAQWKTTMEGAGPVNARQQRHRLVPDPGIRSRHLDNVAVRRDPPPLRRRSQDRDLCWRFGFGCG